MKLRLGGFYEGKKVTTCLVSGPGGKWQCRFQILIGDFDFFFLFFFFWVMGGTLSILNVGFDVPFSNAHLGKVKKKLKGKDSFSNIIVVESCLYF